MQASTMLTHEAPPLTPKPDGCNCGRLTKKGEVTTPSTLNKPMVAWSTSRRLVC